MPFVSVCTVLTYRQGPILFHLRVAIVRIERNYIYTLTGLITICEVHMQLICRGCDFYLRLGSTDFSKYRFPNWLICATWAVFCQHRVERSCLVFYRLAEASQEHRRHYMGGSMHWFVSKPSVSVQNWTPPFTEGFERSCRIKCIDKELNTNSTVFLVLFISPIKSISVWQLLKLSEPITSQVSLPYQTLVSGSGYSVTAFDFEQTFTY